jgi:autotransporter-associated beta strand protein
MISTYQSRLAAIILAQMALLGSVHAQTTWDAGGGVDTNINLATNWNNNTLPAFTSASRVTFTTGGIANINTDVAFGPSSTGPTPAVQFGGNFELSAGGGNVTLFGSNSGSFPVLRSNSAASAVTINAPLRVFSTAPAASPLGNLLVLNVNNTTAANTALNITGGIALASGSTASTYDIRFGNGSGGATGATGRIAGTISGLGTVANANAVWNGKLVFAGSQSLSTSNITIGSGAGFGNPTASAQVVLGETSADVQTWNNVTLNNTMTVAVGGSVSINAISGTTTSGRVVGTGASGAELSITSGTLNSANIAVGGSTVAEKTLAIVKQNSGTLTVSGAHTYTGSTTVNGGTLTLNAGTTLATSGITVNSGGTLNNAATGITAGLTVNAGGTLAGEGGSGALAFGNGTSTFTFDPASPGAFTAASYTANSNALVLLTPSSATTLGDSYLVLTSTAGFGGTVPSEFAASARGTLALASGNTQVNFTPTADASLIWKGNVNGNWDVVTSQNWTNSGSADRFYANDSVTFDDTASASTVVVSGSAVSVGSLAFTNSSINYALSGLGISSAVALTKSGSGSVTVGNTVTAPGVTVTGGSLTLSAAANLGAGGISVTGGSLTLGAANTATGDISVNTGGTLNANNGTNATTGALGSFAAARNVTLDGGTLNYGGAGTISTDNLNLSISGASGFGVTNAGVTLRAGGVFSGSGVLTVGGQGILALGRNSADATWGAGYSGDIVVGSGSVLSLRNEQSLGNTSGTTTIQSGGTLLMDPFNQNSISFAAESIAFQGNSTLSNRRNGQTSLATTLTGTLSTDGVLGVNTLNNTAGSATLTFNGAISGAGGVTFGAPNTVTGLSAVDGVYVLNASNSYTGPTTLLTGTVQLGANERLSNSSALVLGGGTLDLNGFSETLGFLDLDANATIALGASNSISFAASAAQDWGSFTLNFTSVGGSLVPQSVRFGTNASGLSAGQLSLITVDGLGGYALDGGGYLTAVPEPASWAALAGLAAVGLVGTRRRRTRA